MTNILRILKLFILSSTFILNQGFARPSAPHLQNCKSYEFTCGICDHSYIESFLGDLENPNANPGLLTMFEDPSKAPKDLRQVIESTNSVEKFLANFEKIVGKEVSDNFKNNVMILDPSRSLQEGRRYLTQSPLGDVTFSFSHSDKGSGSKAIEMLFYHPQKGEFELAEINFESGKAKVERNPSKCLHCHGKPPNIKPMMEFVQWPNAIPNTGSFNKHDDDDKELLKNMVKLQRDVFEAAKNDKDERLDYLAPYFRNHIGVRDLATTGSFENFDPTYRYESIGNSAQDFTSNLGSLNECRINRTISHTPVKDLIFIGLSDCFNSPDNNDFQAQESTQILEKMLGEDDKKAIMEYYCKRHQNDPAYCGSFKKLFEKIKSDYKRRVDKAFLEKLQRGVIVKAMRKGLKGKDLTDFLKEKGVQSDSLFGKGGTDLNKRVWFQILLEPFGIDLNLLTMTIDSASHEITSGGDGHLFDPIRPQSRPIDEPPAYESLNFIFSEFWNTDLNEIGYQFTKDQLTNLMSSEAFAHSFFKDRYGDLFEDQNISKLNMILSRLKEYAEWKSNQRKIYCQKIKSDYENIIASSDVNLKIRCHQNYITSPRPLKTITKESLSSIEHVISREKVGAIFSKYCISCHSTRAFGAPTHLPFSDMNEFEQFIKSQSTSKFGYTSIIIDRLSRPTSEHGSMPLFGGIEEDERKLIINYIRTLSKQHGQEPLMR